MLCSGCWGRLEENGMEGLFGCCGRAAVVMVVVQFVSGVTLHLCLLYTAFHTVQSER